MYSTEEGENGTDINSFKTVSEEMVEYLRVSADGRRSINSIKYPDNKFIMDRVCDEINITVRLQMASGV